MGLGTEVETSVADSAIFEVELLFTQAVVDPRVIAKMAAKSKVRITNPLRAE